MALSTPPVGFYPLAWVGLVPLLVRWTTYREWGECVREVFALFLVFSTATGFWALFEPSTLRSVLGLGMLIVVPLPVVLAFGLSFLVRRRFGLAAGLVVLVVDLLAFEFLALQIDAGIPWLLLGHTQVEAIPFIQTAELGGVLLLSVWVLLLNVTALLSLPVRRVSTEGLPTWEVPASGLGVAVLAVAIALPSVYGAVRGHQAEAPSGFARLGVIQPGISALAWESHAGNGRVDHLAGLSDRLIERWVSERAAPGDSLPGVAPSQRRSSAERWSLGRSVSTHVAASGGLIVWPQDAIPSVGTVARQDLMYSRLREWCRLRDVSLLTGARTLIEENAKGAAQSQSSALYITATGSPVRRTALTRAAPHDDAPTLFANGGVQVAALVGVEARSGALVRAHADDGANLVVVLARSGKSGGEGAHVKDLALARLRAIETRRSVVVTSASGATAMFSPAGQTDRLAGWMEQGLIPLDVPTYRTSTFYVRHGDWLGRLALGLGVALHLGLAAIAYVRPTPNRLRERAKAFTGGIPSRRR